MKIELEALLRFISSMSVEDKMYFRVPYIFGGIEREKSVDLIYYASPGHWMARFPTMGLSLQVRNEDLPGFLIERNLDLAEFTGALTHRVLTQITYANMILEKGVQLFGPEIIERAIEQQHEFQDKLVSAVESILKPKPKLVKE